MKGNRRILVGKHCDQRSPKRLSASGRKRSYQMLVIQPTPGRRSVTFYHVILMSLLVRHNVEGLVNQKILKQVEHESARRVKVCFVI